MKFCFIRPSSSVLSDIDDTKYEEWDEGEVSECLGSFLSIRNDAVVLCILGYLSTVEATGKMESE